MARLVLLRHGESQWNLENRFTGWTDVGLTEQGCAEAHLDESTKQARVVTYFPLPLFWGLRGAFSNV